LEPAVKHIQVGKESMKKDVDVRKNILLKSSQAMVLAARWSVDTIFSTNNEKRPLLIGAGKDTNRRNFPDFLCFLPSEQRWVGI
jgi:hypothetical protein